MEENNNAIQLQFYAIKRFQGNVKKQEIVKQCNSKK